MENKKSGVYAIKNHINDFVYIGSSSNLGQRKSAHFSELRKYTHYNKPLMDFVNMHSISVIYFDILEYCPLDKLLEREQFYMDLYQNKFNIVSFAGTTKGKIHTIETRLKISNALLSANLKGIPKSEATRLKMKQPKSKEHCNSIKAAQKNVIKRVFQYDFNFTLINTFESLSDTARITGYCRKQISCCCNGKKQNSVKGFIFTFIEINEQNKEIYQTRLKRTFKSTQHDIKETWK